MEQVKSLIWAIILEASLILELAKCLKCFLSAYKMSCTVLNSNSTAIKKTRTHSPKLKHKTKQNKQQKTWFESWQALGKYFSLRLFVSFCFIFFIYKMDAIVLLPKGLIRIYHKDTVNIVNLKQGVPCDLSGTVTASSKCLINM